MVVERGVTRVVETSSLSDAGGRRFAAALSQFAIEAALEPDGESNLRLRALAHHLPINIWAIDHDGNFTQAFGRALRRLGIDDDVLVGAHIGLFGPEAASHLTRAVEGEAAAFEVEGMADSGRWVFTVYVVPMPKAAGAVAVSVDITDQIVAEEAAAAREHARRESEERFRLVAENAPIGIFIVGVDSRITYINPHLAELLQRERESALGHEWFEFVHPDDLQSAKDFDARVRHDVGPSLLEYRLLQNDGSVRWMRTRVAVMRLDGGQGVAAVGTTADITDSMLAAEQLRESEDTIRAILESAAEGIITVSDKGRIVEFNAAAERIFGYDSEEAIGMPVERLIATEQRDLLMGFFNERVLEKGESPSGPPREALALRSDGEAVPVELRVTEVQSRSGRLFTGVVHDISERKAFEQELEHQATHDHLTGLPNRALLTAQLEGALTRANRHKSSVGVLFVELDRVKLVTDTLGHRAGDQLVLEVADRLQKVVRPSGTVTRFGGSQFVVFCEELEDVGDAAEVAVRILEVIDEPFRLGPEEAFITASVGIAFSPLGMSKAETLISNADVAMYRAKEREQRYEIFDAEMRAWVESQRKIEIALRYGIERDEFELFYQPIVGLTDGRVVGVEALARWNHPTLGLLPPSEFIPVAEDGGLIVPLGEQLLRQATDRLAHWQRTHPRLFVSVNLSGRQLGLPDLGSTVRHALTSAGADPIGLHLEITETVLLRDVDSAVESLQDLKDIGVKLCLDDFGTGYSSLSYLTGFPVDTLKVDRSFVSELGVSDRDSSIVTMIVSMANTLRLDVVAEGVETVEQRDILTALDCRHAQGFLFARPQRWSDVDELLGQQLGPSRS